MELKHRDLKVQYVGDEDTYIAYLYNANMDEWMKTAQNISAIALNCRLKHYDLYKVLPGNILHFRRKEEQH